MADVSITCVKPVEQETEGPGGAVERLALEPALTLKKEIGNARLVSGDTVLWVGGASLSAREGVVRVASGKRSFVFSVSQDAAGAQFLADLKTQVEGQAGLAVRRKKRKIRKQLTQSMGFVPTNTLKSPAKKPPATPKRTPLSDLSSPRKPLTPKLDVSVASVPDAYQTLASPASSSKSPFRSPFRKKATPPSGSPALRRLSSPMPLNVLEPPSPAPSPARAREWLSPIRSMRVRRGSIGSGSSDGKKSANSGGVPASTSSTTSSRRSSVGGVLNKRVRSLQLMLDDNEVAGSSSTPVKTAGEQKSSAQKSPYFFKKPPVKPKQGSPSPALSPALQPTAPHGENIRSSSIDEPMLSPVAHNASIFDASPSQNPPSGVPVPSPHGLLNLGNFCYMNAIVQALASLPDFIPGAENAEDLVQLIHKQISKGGPARKSLDEIRATLDTWKSSGDAKRLVLQTTLQQLLRQVIDGSETSITPEPLKHVMGRRNAIFATHFQQDAHEFLLNLLNEYELELADAVKSCVTKIQVELNPNNGAASSSSPKKSSLLSYFRPSQKHEATKNAEQTPTTKQSEMEAQHDLVGDLPPAKCFRAELFRSLTCRNCGYSRKQVETFYDFSLDLPFVDHLAGSSQLGEPGPEPVGSPSLLPDKKCFCGHSPSLVDKESERIYCCPESACSFIEKEPHDNKQDAQADEAMLITPPSSQGDTSNTHSVPMSLDLDALIRKQFEPEVLELTCEKCKTGKEAESGYAVKSLPPVVVLHLKRFEVDPMTGALYKRSDPVLAPASIDFTHSISNDAPNAALNNKYILKSVVHHLGRSIDEGHYVADICDASGRWIRRNDTHESLITEEYALRATRSQESCYMLFYVRADRVNRGDKENVPVSKRTDAENAANTSAPTSDSKLRAFL